MEKSLNNFAVYLFDRLSVIGLKIVTFYIVWYICIKITEIFFFVLINFVNESNQHVYNINSDISDEYIKVFDNDDKIILKIEKTKKNNFFDKKNLESVKHFITTLINFLFIIIFFIIIDFNIDIAPNILPFKLDISFISILLVKQKTEFLMDLISIVNMLYFKVIDMKRLYRIDIGSSERYFYIDDISSTHVFGYFLNYNNKNNKIVVDKLKYTKIPLNNFKSYIITDV